MMLKKKLRPTSQITTPLRLLFLHFFFLWLHFLLQLHFHFFFLLLQLHFLFQLHFLLHFFFLLLRFLLHFFFLRLRFFLHFLFQLIPLLLLLEMIPATPRPIVKNYLFLRFFAKINKNNSIKNIHSIIYANFKSLHNFS